MKQSPFPLPPGVELNTLDGTAVEMYPVMYEGVLMAFAWKPDAESALDLLCAVPASQQAH